jgi:hypothetical protein
MPYCESAYDLTCEQASRKGRKTTIVTPDLGILDVKYIQRIFNLVGEGDLKNTPRVPIGARWYDRDLAQQMNKRSVLDQRCHRANSSVTGIQSTVNSEASKAAYFDRSARARTVFSAYFNRKSWSELCLPGCAASLLGYQKPDFLTNAATVVNGFYTKHHQWSDLGFAIEGVIKFHRAGTTLFSILTRTADLLAIVIPESGEPAWRTWIYTKVNLY